MKKYIIICVLFAGEGIACEGGMHLEIGAGKNGNLTSQHESTQWEDGGGVGSYFSLRYEWKYAVCQGSHYSQWNVGPPFNDKPESSLDHLGCAFRLKLL